MENTIETSPTKRGMSRRDFIKKVGRVIGGIVATPVVTALSGCSPSAKETPKPLEKIESPRLTIEKPLQNQIINGVRLSKEGVEIQLKQGNMPLKDGQAYRIQVVTKNEAGEVEKLLVDRRITDLSTNFWPDIQTNRKFYARAGIADNDGNVIKETTSEEVVFIFVPPPFYVGVSGETKKEYQYNWKQTWNEGWK